MGIFDGDVDGVFAVDVPTTLCNAIYEVMPTEAQILEAIRQGVADAIGEHFAALPIVLDAEPVTANEPQPF